MKQFPDQSPLRRLKTTVRKRLEDYFGASVEEWDASRVAGIREE